MSSTAYWTARRAEEDRRNIAASDAAYRLRRELESTADSPDECEFVSGGHFITLRPQDGDARGLRRAISPQCDHDEAARLVDGHADAMPSHGPSAGQAVVNVVHDSAGWEVRTLYITLVGRDMLSRLKMVGASLDDVRQLALRSRMDDYYSCGQPCVVVITAYSRDGDIVGRRVI